MLRDRPTPLAVLWLCEPDHTQHGFPLGSPEHRQAITGAETCVAAVAETVADLRSRGDDVLLLVGADHGHETVDRVAPLEDRLIAAGFKAGPDSTDVVIASNGLSANIYLADEARSRLDDIVRFLEDETGSTRYSPAPRSPLSAIAPKRRSPSPSPPPSRTPRTRSASPASPSRSPTRCPAKPDSAAASTAASGAMSNTRFCSSTAALTGRAPVARSRPRPSTWRRPS